MNKINLSHELPLLLAIIVVLFLIYISGRNDTFKFICYGLLIIAIVLVVFGCSAPRYCQPSKGSKDYATITQVGHDADGLTYVRAKRHFYEWHGFFRCPIDSFKIGACVDVNGWQKI